MKILVGELSRPAGLVCLDKMQIETRQFLVLPCLDTVARAVLTVVLHVSHHRAQPDSVPLVVKGSVQCQQLCVVDVPYGAGSE